MTKYYTTSEVAKICNVHRNTIIGAIRKGLLKIHRTPGGHARIAQEDLDDFCHRRSLPTTSLISRNNRLLILDSDAQFAATLSRGLLEYEYQVETARDALNAGYLLGRFQPNIVLLERKLGDLAGEEVCRAIRALPKLRNTAVIGISTSADDETMESMVEAGVDDFIAKPFDLEALVERIVRLIGPVIRGTTGRATTGRITGKLTRRISPPSDELDDKATRKAQGPRGGFRTTADGVLSAADLEDEDND